MAHIKKIAFDRCGKNEGCVCDRCGQYIRNIVTVSFTDDVTMHYGIDCFEKLSKTGNLTTQGKKMLKKAVEQIDNWTCELAKWKNGEYTAENRIDWQLEQEDKMSPWYGLNFAEYRNWYIEKFIPVRLEEQQKTINKFRKANFDR